MGSKRNKKIVGITQGSKAAFEGLSIWEALQRAGGEVAVERERAPDGDVDPQADLEGALEGERAQAVQRVDRLHVDHERYHIRL